MTYPAWTEPTSKETAYDVGARVLHDGAVWESTVKENYAEPGAGEEWALVEPSLRTKALAAYTEAESAWKGEALDALTAVIGEDSVDTMNLADAEVTETFHLAVWADGDLHLATRQRAGGPWETFLVADDGGWVEKSGPLESLADLGAALAGGK